MDKSGDKGRERLPAHRQGDLGGSANSPTKATGGSPNVFINGKPAMRQGDEYEDGSILTEGSSSVFINGKPAGRIFSKISKGGAALTGSSNVFIGDKSPITVQEEKVSACEDAQKKVLQETEQIKNSYNHDVERIGRGYTPFSNPPLTELGKVTLMPSQYIEINRAIVSAYKKLIEDAPSLPWAKVGHVVAAQFGCNMRSMQSFANVFNNQTYPTSPEPFSALIIANDFDDMVRAIGEGNIRIFEALYPTMRLVADLGSEKFLDCAKNGHFNNPIDEDLIKAIEELQKGDFATAEKKIVKYEQRKIAPPIYHEFRSQYESLQSLAGIIKISTSGLWDLQSVLPVARCPFPPGTSWKNIAPVSMEGSLFNENDRIKFYQKLAPYIYKYYGKEDEEHD